jgi:hypothetical protein
VRDYRGFDEREGWRHGVAHGADFALQLALNPALDRAALDRLLGAIASQVVPRGGHFYVYGEPERLAAPVLYIGKRNLHDVDEWRKWFAALAEPKPLASWRDAFKSQAGLAKRTTPRRSCLRCTRTCAKEATRRWRSGCCRAWSRP